MRLDQVAAVEGTLMGSSSKAVLHHVKGVCSWGAVRPTNCITSPLVFELALAARLKIT